MKERPEKRNRGNYAKKIAKKESLQKSSSTLIKAMFAKYEERISCADGDSDINLIPPDLFADLGKRGAKMTVKEYTKPKRYNMALTSSPEGEEIFFECDKKAVLNSSYIFDTNVTWS